MAGVGGVEGVGNSDSHRILTGHPSFLFLPSQIRLQYFTKFNISVSIVYFENEVRGVNVGFALSTLS